MQGTKTYTPKLFTTFNLSERIPADNFYRKLKEKLDLSFLYKITKPYYGDCGQKGIDPVVFFKLLLIGYLENLASDRKIVEICKPRLDVLYFIDHDIDDELPWHSTLSRTRQRIPEEIFHKVFEQILQMCIEKGMVSGHAEAIDSALIKANASMDNIEVKRPLLSSRQYLEELELNSEEENISKKSDSRVKSNDIKYNPNDPEAKIATKPGKSPKFSYLSQAVVDSSHHVIVHAEAYHADKKDSQCLQQVVDQVEKKLSDSGIKIQTLLADTNYSSGSNYQYLEDKGIEAFIPLHGQIKLDKEGFIYDEEKDSYQCQNHKELGFRGFKERSFGWEKRYSSTSADCKDCPYKTTCLGKDKQKTIMHSIHRKHYEKMKEKVESRKGKLMTRLRMSTVEPIFGSLIHYYGLRKIWVKGKTGASKVMMMSAAAYNLKKYLRFIERVKHKAIEIIRSAKNIINIDFQLY